MELISNQECFLIYFSFLPHHHLLITEKHKIIMAISTNDGDIFKNVPKIDIKNTNKTIPIHILKIMGSSFNFHHPV